MMLTFRARNVAAIVVLACFVASCSREQEDWRAAEAADTADGYGQFMQRHPDSELVTQARTRVAQLEEDLEWQRVGGVDTPDAYRQFLAEHPSGKWAQEARIRLQNFALGAATSGSSATDTGASAAGIANAGAAGMAAGASASAAGGAAGVVTATGADAPAVRATPPDVATVVADANPTGYGIQLGAFTSESAANSQWQLLVTRFGADLHGLTPRVVSLDTANGRLFRLQAAVPDESRARGLCDVLKKQSQACVPVLPH